MSKEFKYKGVWQVFCEGLGIYCRNIHKFTGYMLFPVFGQILGLVLIFGAAFLFAQHLPELGAKYKVFADLTTMALCLLLITLPGMLVFMKAFWDYLVAYGAINSMTQGALETGRVYDFRAHNRTVTDRVWTFIGLWCLFGIFGLIAFFPLFWVPGLVLFVYFVLIFQVFSFGGNKEENLRVSPVYCFKQSFSLVKGHFFSTAGLAIILFLFTYYLLPQGVSVLLKAPGWFVFWVDKLPLDAAYIIFQKANFILTPEIIANYFLNIISAGVVIMLTLPLRSICWALWYKNLSEPIPIPKKSRRKETPREDVEE